MGYSPKGLTFTRHFTTNDTPVFDTVTWETRDATITGADGTIVFEQRGVEVPSTWSQLATNITASKYFRGQLGSPEREYSVKQLISRVVDTIVRWGEEGTYFNSDTDRDTFDAEVKYLMLHQMMLPNSPTLFNLGWEGRRQAVSACYITAAEDNMASILDLYKTEGMLFSDGSGAGSNLSNLRSSKEGLKAGGRAGGPVSFMKGLDANAGSIASGGATRRAALLRCLNIDHPDIHDFIHCKEDAEKKAHALIAAGFDSAFNVPGGAYDSIHFQNANISVRVTDDFMEAVEDDGDWELKTVTTGKTIEKLKARDLFREISTAASACGDPGAQFHDTINKWNGVKNSGVIRGSNPCFSGDTRIATTEGLIPISELVENGLDGEFPNLITKDGVVSRASRLMVTGFNPIREVHLSDGRMIRCTPNHKWIIFDADQSREVVTDDLKEGMIVCGLSQVGKIPHVGNEFIPADCSLKKYIRKNNRELHSSLPEKWTEEFALILGDLIGNGTLATTNATVVWIFGTHDDQKNILANRIKDWLNNHLSCSVGFTEVGNGCVQVRVSRYQFMDFLKELGFFDKKAHEKIVPESIFRAPLNIIAGFLRGYFGADGTVYGKPEDGSVAVNCSSASLNLLRGIQQLLDLFNIRSKISLLKEGGNAEFYYNNKNHERKAYISKDCWRLNIVAQDISLFAESIGFSVNYKEIRLKELLNSRKIVSKLDRRHALSIEKVEDCGQVELTYNLTEPKNHTVFANGIYIAQCSEFHQLDFLSCTLASLNLLKFLSKENTFNVVDFHQATKLTATMLEISISGADFPTSRITEMSRSFRPIGIGYANLGAILMAKGLAYDSDEGRSYAEGITALLTGSAYLQSAVIARDCGGPFQSYDDNKGPMLDVVSRHQQDAKIYKNSQFQPALATIWRNAYEIGEQVGFRNCEVTCAAPTGSISLGMGCDTSGVEPAIALVAYKKLVGGGTLKLANHTVERGLGSLKYSQEKIDQILAYVSEYDSIEGCSALDLEHLPVFDCALPAGSSARAISPDGHLKMTAAVQKFFSMGVSKTINCPNNYTVEDIERMYMEAWKLGIKSISVYRDGCKASQPLNTKKTETPVELPVILPTSLPVRRRLPNDREAICHKFDIAGYEGYIHVGLYEDGSPGEVFIRMAKEGSTISGLMDGVALLTSLSLQYGVPLEAMVDKFSHTRFEPSGFTQNKDVPYAHSLTDYLFRFLGNKYLPKDELVQMATNPAIIADNFPVSQPIQSDAPTCTNCGSLVYRNGSCFVCKTCGSTTGCS